MADKKDTHKEFSTCFEKLPFAEMMQKMMKECSKVQEEPEESKEEMYHGRKESRSEVDE